MQARYIPLLISLVWYALSLTVVAFRTESADIDVWPGWGLLLYGWIGIVDWHFAWFANPLLLVAWILLLAGKTQRASQVGQVSLALMLTFLMYGTIAVNERGLQAPITGYGLGYWFWVASAVVMAIAPQIVRLSARRVRAF